MYTIRWGGTCQYCRQVSDEKKKKPGKNAFLHLLLPPPPHTHKFWQKEKEITRSWKKLHFSRKNVTQKNWRKTYLHGRLCGINDSDKNHGHGLVLWRTYNTGFLQTFHSTLHKCFTNFQDHVFQNSEAKFDTLLPFDSPHVLHVHPSLYM